MIQETVTLDHVLEVLNDALEIDPEAMNDLVEARVPCSEALAEHPTIQVHTVRMTVFSNNKSEETKTHTVGLIGILNGLFGADNDQWGTIAGEFDIECPGGCALPEGHRTQPGPCLVCGATTEMGKLTKFVDLGRR